MQEVAVLLFDDVDFTEAGAKTPADRTISLGYEGTWYELDVSERHSDELGKLLDRWLLAGRRLTTAPRKPPRAPRERKDKAFYDDMRQFAKEHDLKLKPDGGFPPKVRRMYEEYLADV